MLALGLPTSHNRSAVHHIYVQWDLPVAPAMRSCMQTSQRAQHLDGTAQAPTFNYAGEARRRFCGGHKLLGMVSGRPSAAVRQAKAAAAGGGKKRPYPTLGKIGSLAKLWTLYSVGDAGFGEEAWEVREQGGKAWRSGYEPRWNEFMLLINLIRERAEAPGKELAAAQRMDEAERLEGATLLSLSQFVNKLKGVKKVKKVAHGATG